MSVQPDAQALQEAIDKMTIGEMQSRYMFALDWHDPEPSGIDSQDGAKAGSA